MRRDSRQNRHTLDDRGFTLVEFGIAMSAFAIVAAVSIGAFRQYAEATAARKAAVQMAADVALTRSFAIQRREDVSMVVDETNLRYVIRDAAGTVFMRREFGTTTETPLSGLRVSTTGDSLTFNSRGLLAQGTAQINVARQTHTQQLRINALGRTDIN
ncbi:MAG: GspH/FimT family pseudopilin [Gemmatimonadota bacterium]|nr:GspH/FimT family pseudopilin [Gemmatimonadota bacterium]